MHEQQTALIFDRAPRLTEQERLVYGAIYSATHFQPGSTIGKAELAAKVGLSVRLTRRIIADLVTNHGMPIGCSSDNQHGGYYIMTNPAEIEAAQRELRSRALKLLKREYALQRSPKLAAILGQLEL